MLHDTALRRPTVVRDNVHIPDLNFAAIPGVIWSENTRLMFQDERMFFQLESPKVQLSIGLNDPSKILVSLSKVEGGDSNHTGSLELKNIDDGGVKRLIGNEDPLINAFRRGGEFVEG